MKTLFYSLKWRRLILVAFLIGGTLGTLNASSSFTTTNANGPVCPAPPACRTPCYTGTKDGTHFCSSSCGLYSCV